MKYIKMYEDFDFESLKSLKRGDVISVEEYRYVSPALYVVLESTIDNVTIFYIGHTNKKWQKPLTTLCYNSREHQKKIITSKSRWKAYNKLSIEEMNRLFDAIYHSPVYVRKIKERSGFDLETIEGYNDFNIQNKYNL